MTGFEQMLIDKGYVMHVMNCKTMKLEIPNRHNISTMVNLDHRYIHPDNGDMVIFGLHEKGGPATLIWPRPLMRVKRSDTEEEWERNVVSDDNMNVVLQKVDNERIYEAILDKFIVINIDLTKDE